VWSLLSAKRPHHTSQGHLLLKLFTNPFKILT
jgi:hypothetical protein